METATEIKIPGSSRFKPIGDLKLKLETSKWELAYWLIHCSSAFWIRILMLKQGFVQPFIAHNYISATRHAWHTNQRLYRQLAATLCILQQLADIHRSASIGSYFPTAAMPQHNRIEPLQFHPEAAQSLHWRCHDGHMVNARILRFYLKLWICPSWP